MAIGLQFLNGDFVLSNKKIVFVQNIDKVRRDFVKFLVTDKETTLNKTSYSRYNPNYGTNINNTELYKNLTPKATLDMLELQLTESIKYYITLQETRTNLSLSEVISDLAFSVYQDLNDPQKIKFNIQVKVASGQATTVNLSQEV
jgi:hypothetical protein